jgi:hypothetical protein
MTAKDIDVPAAPVARKFVRYVISFGVSVGIGLAPFLGKVKVPGFSALLELFPLQIQGVLVPLSAFLMGLVALAVQFYYSEKVAAGSLRKYFRAGFIAIVLGFFLFVILYKLFVIRVPIAGGESYAAVVVNPDRLRRTCKCPESDTDYDCVKKLSLHPAALATCWGGEAQDVRELALMVPYLLLTAGFGALIGLLILKEDRQGAVKPARPARKPPKAPRPKRPAT